jgi:hypothetical protein
MNTPTQIKFYEALVESQKKLAKFKMPYLCIAGSRDFDMLKAIPSFVNKPTGILREWTVPQADFDKETPDARDAAWPADLAALDKRQADSLTEWFSFCGCKVYRALSVETGFIFA